MKTVKKQKDTGRKTHILQREDVTGYALDLGIWHGLTKDQGESQELTREMGMLEANRKTLEARLHELAVQIAYQEPGGLRRGRHPGGAAALRALYLQAPYRAANSDDPPAGEPGAAF